MLGPQFLEYLLPALEEFGGLDVLVFLDLLNQPRNLELVGHGVRGLLPGYFHQLVVDVGHLFFEDARFSLVSQCLILWQDILVDLELALRVHAFEVLFVFLQICVDCGQSLSLLRLDVKGVVVG